MTTGHRQRQSVTFTDEAADAVVDLAKKRGTSVSEVVREAVALQVWLEQTKDAGEKVYVGQEPGPKREVEFIR